MKMKRIFLSIVAAVAIFGASFAINHPKPVLVEFTVTAEDAQYYTVSTSPDLIVRRKGNKFAGLARQPRRIRKTESLNAGHCNRMET
jgi:hypothetical protein